MPERILGPGGYTTLQAAVNAAANGDTIIITDNWTEPNNLLLSGKDSLTVQGNGHTCTHQGGGGDVGWTLRNMRDFWVRDLTCVLHPDDRNKTSGACFGQTNGCCYNVFMNLDISYYIQAGINTNPYQGGGSEFWWVDQCHIHHIDVNGTFDNDGSCISSYQPGVVAGQSPPARWTAKLDADIPAAARVWPDGWTRDITDLVVIATRNTLTDYTSGGAVDTDSNGGIIDDWQCNQTFLGFMPDYTAARPGAWSLWENNIIKNMRGAGVRIYSSSRTANPCPHVIRNNTADNVGQRTPGLAPNGSAFGIAIAGDCNFGPMNETVHHAAVYNNAIVNSGGGPSTGFCGSCYTVSRHTTYHSDNISYNSRDGVGLGVESTADPLLDANYFPTAGSAAINAGIAGPAFDRIGQPRSPTTPTIGALEVEGEPVGTGTVEVVSVAQQSGLPSFTVPTVADGDLLLVFGSALPSAQTGYTYSTLGQPGPGWMVLFDNWTPASWATPVFALYRLMAAADTGTSVTVPHADNNHPEFDLAIVRVSGVDGTTPVKSVVNGAPVINGTSPVLIPSPGDVGVDGAAFWVAGIQHQNAEPTAASVGQLYTDTGWGWNSLAWAWRSYGAAIPAPVNAFTIAGTVFTHYSRSSFILNAGSPVAAPSAEFDHASTELQTTFTDQSTGDVSTWDWDFDDGSPFSNEQNPVHDFATAGTYNVVLTVTGPGGSDFVTHPVTVTGDPPGNITRASATLLL